MSLLRRLARAGAAPAPVRPSPPPSVSLLGGAADGPAEHAADPVRSAPIATRDEPRQSTTPPAPAHDAGVRALVGDTAHPSHRAPDVSPAPAPADPERRVPPRPMEIATDGEGHVAPPAVSVPAATGRVTPPAHEPTVRRDAMSIAREESARRTSTPTPDPTPSVAVAGRATPAPTIAPAAVSTPVVERVGVDRNVVAPRLDGRTEPAEGARASRERDRPTAEPTVAHSTPPADPGLVEVRIGTIEIHEASEPATAGPPSPRGFADVAAVRAYDWGGDG